MPSPTMLEEKFQANLHKRELAKDFIQVSLRTEGRGRVALRCWKMILRCRAVSSVYDWVYENVAGTPSTLSTETSLSNVDIRVYNSLEWSILPVPKEKKICTSFDDCMVPFYECWFTRVGLRVPFSEFDVIVLKNLKVASSNLHLRSWACIRVFQLCVNHKL